MRRIIIIFIRPPNTGDKKKGKYFRHWLFLGKEIILDIGLIMFIKLTLVAEYNKDGDLEPISESKLNINVDCIESFITTTKGYRVVRFNKRSSRGKKLYVIKESIEEIEEILRVVESKTAKVLFGKTND